MSACVKRCLLKLIFELSKFYFKGEALGKRESLKEGGGGVNLFVYDKCIDVSNRLHDLSTYSDI